jgi:hypothetical protein
MYCIIVLTVKLMSSVLSLIVFNFCDWLLGLPYKCKLFYAFVELIPSSFIGSFSLMLMSYWMRGKSANITCHRCISESFLENVRLSSTIYRVIGDFLHAATSSLKRFQKGSLELAQFKGPSARLVVPLDMLLLGHQKNICF